MPTTVTRAASTFSNNTGTGTLAWGPVTAASLLDSVYASASGATSGTYETNYLYAQKWGLNVPLTASVNGWTLTVRRYCSQSAVARYATDSKLFTLVGGALAGSSMANTVTKWPNAAACVIYGASNDAWNTSGVGPETVNASTFGFAIAASITRTTTNAITYIDYLELALTYTDATTTTQAVRTMHLMKQGR